MKRYMVIGYGDGNTWAAFFDSYEKAESYRMDGAVSLGYRMQVYEWTETEYGGEYCFIYE